MLTEADKDAIALTLIGEAGNQGAVGAAAVAHVIRNRINDGKYGKDAQDVLFAPSQFEPWNNGQTRQQLLAIPKNDPRYIGARAIVDDVWNGTIPDITKGATHFQNPDTVDARGNASGQAWRDSMQRNGSMVRIGAHVFGRPDGAPGRNSSPVPTKNGTGRSGVVPSSSSAATTTDSPPPATTSLDDDLNSVYGDGGGDDIESSLSKVYDAPIGSKGKNAPLSTASSASGVAGGVGGESKPPTLQIQSISPHSEPKAVNAQPKPIIPQPSQQNFAGDARSAMREHDVEDAPYENRLIVPRWLDAQDKELAGVGETALQIGSSIPAWVVAKGAGVGSALWNAYVTATGGKKSSKIDPNDYANFVREYYTYQPKTKQGKNMSEAVGTVLSPIAAAQEWVGKAVGAGAKAIAPNNEDFQRNAQFVGQTAAEVGTPRVIGKTINGGRAIAKNVKQIKSDPVGWAIENPIKTGIGIDVITGSPGIGTASGIALRAIKKHLKNTQPLTAEMPTAGSFAERAGIRSLKEQTPKKPIPEQGPGVTDPNVPAPAGRRPITKEEKVKKEQVENKAKIEAENKAKAEADAKKQAEDVNRRVKAAEMYKNWQAKKQAEKTPVTTDTPKEKPVSKPQVPNRKTIVMNTTGSTDDLLSTMSSKKKTQTESPKTAMADDTNLSKEQMQQQYENAVKEENARIRSEYKGWPEDLRYMKDLGANIKNGRIIFGEGVLESLPEQTQVKIRGDIDKYKSTNVRSINNELKDNLARNKSKIEKEEENGTFRIGQGKTLKTDAEITDLGVKQLNKKSPKAKVSVDEDGNVVINKTRPITKDAEPKKTYERRKDVSKPTPELKAQIKEKIERINKQFNSTKEEIPVKEETPRIVSDKIIKAKARLESRRALEKAKKDYLSVEQETQFDPKDTSAISKQKEARRKVALETFRHAEQNHASIMKE